MKITKQYLKDIIREVLMTESKVMIPDELKDAFKRKPYDIYKISDWMERKIKFFTGLGIPEYGSYRLNFMKNGKKKYGYVNSKELIDLIGKIVQSGKDKVTLKYVVTKKPIEKRGLFVGGKGYWDIK